MHCEKQLPAYRCHKKVWALKIKQVTKHAHPDPTYDDAAFEASPEFQGAHLHFEDERYAPIPVNADWYRKHDPMPGGYYVVYEDGYASYSPTKAFEDGYKPIVDRNKNTVGRRLSGHKTNFCNSNIQIEVADQPGDGGANHEYLVELTAGRLHNFTISADGKGFLIPFQKGPVNEVGTNGVTHEVLLAIVIDRMQSFQRGPFACRENALALTKLEEALHWLNRRTRERVARGVEGTHNK